ncbi:PREDICTED: thiamine transporter 1-like [Nicrophorus vespilloides]|uniref:Thiamine transporter 1-like n=1 Tax=Nicrophorus vespilloides TaxID=110193 RepID=A0ABM1N9Q2_NICVS|nr:PREDICTED: thiamine transporter 1-like [Nicrophorus vespilloides]XP_017783551.1 PREDICTED: thiamine transporter 1-like [Nicrophorus vespilloides]XP_017783552.1 PREDICTED: thiamine transporter 1-like [Nicrophorus vespilloides]XP_017783553.1 PREDICTED: thiamine transporter 1-like [Nicrophorus vespilloides]
MESWFKISLLLCVFGFIKEFRPSEPFIYEYLSGPWRDLDDDEVTQKVYPVGTYSYLVHLLLVFLITDFLRYKALIVILGLSGIIVWSMLIWTTSLFHLQVLEGVYGTFMSCEVAYYTYIYAKVDTKYYLQVSSHTRASILAGRALSSIVAQLLISFELMDYKELNYISLGAMIIASCWSLFLPNVKKSIYFHQDGVEKVQMSSKFRGAFTLMKTHFLESFSNRYALKWSIWWALTTAGFIQVQVYAQPLWGEILDSSEGSVYNGAVEAAATLLGFLSALFAGYLKIEWKGKGELVLSICAIIAGGLIVLSSQTEYVMVSYICYALYCCIYQFMITIASSEIAKCIADDSYGLVFGINTFIALVLQTILTLIFVEEKGFHMKPRDQHLVYGIYHFLISIVFIIIGLISLAKRRRNNSKRSLTIQ